MSQKGHQFTNIPDPLKERSQWIITKNSRPVNPIWGWNTSQHQFEQACRLAIEHDGELAYVLTNDDPYVVIDLDDVGTDGPATMSEEACGIARRLNTYTEVSRSGTGLHLICEGTRLPDRKIEGEMHDRGSIEVYDSSQYIVITGDQVGSYDKIRDGDGTDSDWTENALINLQQEYLPKRSEPNDSPAESSEFDLGSASRDSIDVGAKDIRRTLEEYAKGNSAEAQRALDRWNSHSSSSREFLSPSELDMAFVADLAFWCQEDAQLIDECFRSSNRMREKWDEVHYSDGRTYGDGTIQTAIRTNYDTFSGHYVRCQ